MVVSGHISTRLQGASLGHEKGNTESVGGMNANMMRAMALVCLNCGHQHHLDAHSYVCERCAWPLAVAYAPDEISATTARGVLASARGMWDLFDFLPVRDRASAVDLGEGGTPLLASSTREDEGLGIEVFMKNETLNPTGAFKDRPLSVILSIAREHGIERVITGSSGNAGVSMSAYAARAGIDATVLVPQSVPAEKLVAMKAFGARVIRINGTCADALSLATKLSAHLGWMCATTTYRNPFGLEGDKTIAYEIVRDLDFSAPSHVFVPIGSGPLMTGCYLGFLDLIRWGVIDTMPRMIGVQAAGCAPIAKAFDEGTENVVAWTNVDTVASGVADELTGYETDGVVTLRTARRSGGAVLGVSDERIMRATEVLAESWGIFSEPSGAVGYAGVRAYAETFGFSRGERAVCIVTGTGLKDMKGIKRIVDTDNIPVVAPTLECLSRAVA